jgi:serine/threonine-protein kinase HipA
LHIDDGDLAMTDHLYAKDYDHPSYSQLGYHAFQDFFTFGEMIGLLPASIHKKMLALLDKSREVEAMVHRSFLKKFMKEEYLKWNFDKLKRLKTNISSRLITI